MYDNPVFKKIKKLNYKIQKKKKVKFQNSKKKK